jgi:hypothetical protein
MVARLRCILYVRKFNEFYLNIPYSKALCYCRYADRILLAYLCDHSGNLLNGILKGPQELSDTARREEPAESVPPLQVL